MIKQTIATPPIDLAQRETLKRLFNAYLRETGVYDPRDPHRPQSLRVQLPRTNRTLIGTLVHFSIGGQHTYGNRFWEETATEQIPLSFDQLMLLLLQEVSASEADATLRQQKQNDLAQMIDNSLKNINTYITHAQKAKTASVPLDFRRLEQSLCYGHPFHPTPKSSEGFSLADLQQYAPEMGTSFHLHYFALSPELVLEGWVDNQTGADAFGRLDTHPQGYALLPCHPWQAKYLLTQPLVQQLVEAGTLVDLGLLGEEVYPTSSVRTVWSPVHQSFYKLSLHIRITNFIRENDREQLYRTLDAAKVVACVRDHYVSEHFSILLEKGFRTLSISGASEAENEALLSSFSVILREAPPECVADNPPYVVAGLFEVPPGETEPTLFRVIRKQRQGDLPDLFDWLQQYLVISLQPVLCLFAETGISLEAHVQNSMLRLRDGFPCTFYVRDLEGSSVNRELAVAKKWVGSIISADSPVLYSPEQAWFRLQYYFFVNHLGHLIQTLACYSQQDETPFWQVVRDVLEGMQAEPLSPLHSLINGLLQNETLPAKANLLSRFQKRGENPLYADIPNPLRITIR